MDRTIWKFPLHIRNLREDDIFEIEMPAGAQILTVQSQGDQPSNWMAWALVDPGAPPEQRRIAVYGTGNPCAGGAYINSFQTNNGAGVWHAFEVSGGR